MIQLFGLSSARSKKLIFGAFALALTYSLTAQNAKTLKIDPLNTVELSEIFESIRVVGLEQDYPALFGFRSPIIKVSGSKIYICPSLVLASR